MEAARVENAILRKYLNSEVALEDHEIRRTDPNMMKDHNWRDDELHFRMPEGCGDYQDKGDQREVCDVIPSARQRRRPTTALERMDLGTSEVDGYEGKDGDDANADGEEEASQPNNESMQNMED
jgi:hypothetical protein